MIHLFVRRAHGVKSYRSQFLDVAGGPIVRACWSTTLMLSVVNQIMDILQRHYRSTSLICTRLVPMFLLETFLWYRLQYKINVDVNKCGRN